MLSQTAAAEEVVVEVVVDALTKAYMMGVSISSPRTMLAVGSHGETEIRTPTLLVRKA
jgi:hypothetical protein